MQHSVDTLPSEPAGDLSSELEGALGACACFKLRRVSRLMTQLYDEALQPTGFRSTQLVIMLALVECGEISHGQLARKVVISPSALTRALKPLSERGFVSFPQLQGRRHSIKITDEGLAATAQAAPYWRKAQG